MASSPYDQIIVFGDSLVEWSSAKDSGAGLVPALQAEYIRRLDVVNRGFDGYNTKQALEILPRVIPSPEHTRVRLLVVLLGANDATSPDAGNGFHVPIEQYKQNLKSIVTHPTVAAHKPRIILLAPPPVNEHKHEIKDKNLGYPGLTRFASLTKSYAKACCEVARELDIPVLDSWTCFMRRTDAEEGYRAGSISAPRSEVLDRLLSDGVHLTAEGYKILFDELMKSIAAKWPELMPESIPYVFPTFN